MKKAKNLKHDKDSDLKLHILSMILWFNYQSSKWFTQPLMFCSRYLTALHIAADKAHYDVMDVLLKQSAKVLFVNLNVSCAMGKPDFCLGKTKVQISFAITAGLICTFVFTTWIVKSLRI